jgi:hypothetical protein
MPVVVPPPTAATSASQTVPTQQVFDYLLDSGGAPVVGAQVICVLNFSPAVTLNPVVSLQAIQKQTVTDRNGYYTFNLIPNANITPGGTVYSVLTPDTTLDISVPSSGGPFQVTQIATSQPAVLQPAVTGLVGPITVTGNETVTGTLTVSGTTTLAGTTTGALSTAAASIGGDLTIASAFRLLFGAAVSKLVPGATSFSVRDNGDANDNLLVTNAGLVTARAGLVATAGGVVATAGDIVATAGRLLVSSAAAKILGGATSLSLRNNADNADNVLVADAGTVTLRNALSVPTSVGGSLPPTSYGSVWLKHDEQSPSGVGTITINVPASGFRDIWIKVYGRGDAVATTVIVKVQFNGDSTASHYTWSNLAATSATPSSSVPAADSSMSMGVLPAASATALLPGQFWLDIPEYLNTTFARTCTSRLGMQSGGTGFEVALFDGNWVNATALSSITVFLSAGNFVAGSRVTTYVIP